MVEVCIKRSNGEPERRHPARSACSSLGHAIPVAMGLEYSCREQPMSLPMITCNSTGVVYSNPRPHLKSVHAWHPSLLELPDGTLLCAFDLGEAPESLDYRTYIAYSSNQGATWSAPRRLVEDQASGVTTHTIRISRLVDGSLVGIGARFHRPDLEEGIANRATMGLVPMDLIQTSSSDSGQTWQQPANVKPPLVGPGFEICHAITQLTSGEWWIPTQTWPDWDGNAPNGMQALALVSHDRGKSWPEYVPIFRSEDGSKIYFEVSVVQMTDGRLLSVAWAYDKETRQTLVTPYALSEDGRTFSAPLRSGIHGQTAKLCALVDDFFVCAYRRHDQPGLWLQLARLDGDRWVNVEELLLWQGSQTGGWRSTNTSDELSGLKFGFPTLRRLKSGEVMIVFWCEEEGLHIIRWCRLNVEVGEHRGKRVLELIGQNG
jgi:sialidase-1